MKTFEIDITKASVYNEVAKLTTYVGKSTANEAGALIYDKVFTTDDDLAMLERFWREIKAALLSTFSTWITSVATTSQIYTDESIDATEHLKMTFTVSDLFDNNLLSSLNDNMFSYVVNIITAKWFAITNRADVEAYGGYATNNLANAIQIMYYKKRPAP